MSSSFGFNLNGVKAQWIPYSKAVPWDIIKRKSDALQGQKYDKVFLLLPLQGVTTMLNFTQSVAPG